MAILENRVIQSPEDKKAVASLLARCFWDAPVNRYIFQDQPDDKAKLIEIWEWVYERRLDISELSGSITYGRFENDNLISTVTVGSIESQHPSLLLVFQSNLWTWPFFYGIPSIQRFMDCGQEIDQKNTEVFKGCVDAHLTLVATDEAYRGHGHAGELIKFALSEVYGVITLDTHWEENVTLYKNLGFRVVASWEMLSNTPYAFTNHLMKMASEA